LKAKYTKNSTSGPSSPTGGSTTTTTPTPEPRTYSGPLKWIDKAEDATALPYYYTADGTRVWVPFSWFDGAKTLFYFADKAKTYEFAHNPKTFDDVEGHWAIDSILFTAEREIFVGVDADTFAPESPITRAQFTAVFARLAGAELGSGATAFDDVPADSWYAPYVAWAAKVGLVNGVSDTKFSPNRPITRAELAALIDRFITYMGFNLTPVRSAIAFTDVDGWAKASIDRLYALGLVNGKSGTLFDVNGDTKRAEAAAVTERLIVAAINAEIDAAVK